MWLRLFAHPSRLGTPPPTLMEGGVAVGEEAGGTELGLSLATILKPSTLLRLVEANLIITGQGRRRGSDVQTLWLDLTF